MSAPPRRARLAASFVMTVGAIGCATPPTPEAAVPTSQATAAPNVEVAPKSELPQAPAGGRLRRDGAICLWQPVFDLRGFKCPPGATCMPPNPPPPMPVQCPPDGDPRFVDEEF